MIFSIKLNSFPRSCKIAKVKLLFKKASKTDPPFHHSPFYYKLLKGLFMTKHKFGVQKDYSTNTCLGHLTYKMTTGFEKGIFTGMTLIDLQKAFDTIDHQILVKKKKYQVFSRNVIAWFKSYLSEQKFKININISYSSPLNLICGVPQGSILGPLLFLLYTNDLPQLVSDSLLYADDTCIVFQHINVTEI